MKTAKIAAFLSAALASTFAVQAQAGVITYDLTDTPHGSAGLLTAGFYKHVGGDLRYESLSFEQNGADVKFVYDDEAGTATVSGKAFNLNTGALFDFDLSYDNVTENNGTLSLGDMDTVGAFGGTTVTGKGFNITLGDTLKGDGWLTSVDTKKHYGDFHFAGVVVPNAPNGGGQVPAPGPLALIAAIGLFGAWRLKRSAQS